MGWYRMLVVAEIPKDRSVHIPTTGGVPVHRVTAGIKCLVQPMLVGINLLITGGMSRRNLVVGVKRHINLIGDPPTTGGVPVHRVTAGIKYLVQPMLVGINLLITGGMSRRNLVVGVKRPINLIGDHRLVCL
jgi:hypothetical protein